MPAPQARYWILTIAAHQFLPYQPPGVGYITGQLETGRSGFVHWQIMVYYRKKVTLTRVRETFGDVHAEITKSEKAREYCLKEETRVPGTQFELGSRPVNRNNKTDWENVRKLAREGRLEDVPADIYVRCYNQLRRIGQDNLQPVAMERSCSVFWGKTKSGKSHRAWEEAGN